MSPIPALFGHAADVAALAATISSIRVAMPTADMDRWQASRLTATTNTVAAFLVFAGLSTVRLRPSSLPLCTAAATCVVQHWQLPPLPALAFWLVAAEAMCLAVCTPFAVGATTDYKSYGCNMASAVLWGLLAANRDHLGPVWPLLFGAFFSLAWPLSQTPLSETAVLASAAIACLMRSTFHLGMAVTYWAAWPVAVLGLYWAFPKNAPLAWNVAGLALLAAMGVAMDPARSAARFQLFAVGVFALLPPREAFLYFHRLR